MGYDILSNTTQKSWTCHHDWGCFLDLAQAFGSSPEHQGGHYYIGNDHQEVSDEDARAMAKALNRAIVYIQDVKHINMTHNGETLRTFDDSDVTHLCALAALADAGSFTIA